MKIKWIFVSFCSCVLLTVLTIDVYGFETEGVPQTDLLIAHTAGEPIHQDITRDGLNFLNPNTVEFIANVHPILELDQSSRNHFDNCQFKETVDRINSRFDGAVDSLNPSNPRLDQAATEFGKILHAAQDFYSHSNWIEMGRTDLIDPWYSHWRDLVGYTSTTHDNPVFVLEQSQNDLRSDFLISKNGKTIRVNHEMWDALGEGNKPGLISGTFGEESESHCPPAASIPHGGKLLNRFFRTPEGTTFPDELNKDNPAIKGHQAARGLATQQTTHEFCRLVILTHEKWGMPGVNLIYDNWLQDPSSLDNHCPLIKEYFVSANDDSYIHDSGDGASPSDIPRWVKTNALWWSQNQIDDKTFALAIGHLVKINLIHLGPEFKITSGELAVSDNIVLPNWINNNARWWSQGLISDDDFLKGIQYMIQENIISFDEGIPLLQETQTPVDAEIIKGLYLASKWDELAANKLLEIKNAEIIIFDDLADETWKEYSERKNMDLMFSALEFENAHTEAQTNSLELVKILKEIKGFQDGLVEITTEPEISKFDLEKLSSELQDQIENVDHFEDVRKIELAHKEVRTHLEESGIIIDGLLSEWEIIEPSLKNYPNLPPETNYGITTSPDGTTTVTYRDGITTMTKPDGTFVFTHPDGTTTESYPDGIMVTTYLDGTIIIVNSDGRVTTTYPDGTEITSYPDGTTLIDNPSGKPTDSIPRAPIIVRDFQTGSVGINHPDFSLTTIYPNGLIEFTRSDGVRTIFPGEGVRTYQHSSGPLLVNPDLTLSVLDELALSRGEYIAYSDESLVSLDLELLSSLDLESSHIVTERGSTELGFSLDTEFTGKDLPPISGIPESETVSLPMGFMVEWFEDWNDFHDHLEQQTSESPLDVPKSISEDLDYSSEPEPTETEPTETEPTETEPTETKPTETEPTETEPTETEPTETEPTEPATFERSFNVYEIEENLSGSFVQEGDDINAILKITDDLDKGECNFDFCDYPVRENIELEVRINGMESISSQCAIYVENNVPRDSGPIDTFFVFCPLIEQPLPSVGNLIHYQFLLEMQGNPSVISDASIFPSPSQIEDFDLSSFKIIYYNPETFEFHFIKAGDALKD